MFANLSTVNKELLIEGMIVGSKIKSFHVHVIEDDVKSGNSINLILKFKCNGCDFDLISHVKTYHHCYLILAAIDHWFSILQFFVFHKT